AVISTSTSWTPHLLLQGPQRKPVRAIPGETAGGGAQRWVHQRQEGLGQGGEDEGRVPPHGCPRFDARAFQRRGLQGAQRVAAGGRASPPRRQDTVSRRQLLQGLPAVELQHFRPGDAGAGDAGGHDPGRDGPAPRVRDQHEDVRALHVGGGILHGEEPSRPLPQPLPRGGRHARHVPHSGRHGGLGAPDGDRAARPHIVGTVPRPRPPRAHQLVPDGNREPPGQPLQRPGSLGTPPLGHHVPDSEERRVRHPGTPRETAEGSHSRGDDPGDPGDGDVRARDAHRQGGQAHQRLPEYHAQGGQVGFGEDLGRRPNPVSSSLPFSSPRLPPMPPTRGNPSLAAVVDVGVQQGGRARSRCPARQRPPWGWRTATGSQSPALCCTRPT
ncbi:unnamed protein product, partial [Pylaiella littoralis]